MKGPHQLIVPLLLPVALVSVIALRFVVGETQPPMSAVAWAQTSSCGNAILDPGEQCDPPGSITCPPGSPSGAILPCNADCTCPVEQVLDHFQCYELKPSQFANVSRTVQDQFGTATMEIRTPIELCNPTNKNGEGIIDPTDHLVAHKVKGPRFTKRLNQTVVDQFGTLLLDVKRPNLLMVPTSKDGVAPVPPLDHFQCYKVGKSKGAAKFVRRSVTVANQFESTTVELLKPARLCAPANKNNEDPTAPSHPEHLLCYKTKGSKLGQQTHTITNQFGTRSALIIRRQELCVPALKNPGVTTTTTPTTTTTTTIATTTTTTSTTTTTTLYGSPSRAFLLPSVTLLD
jgi:hypothetical protein